MNRKFGESYSKKKKSVDFVVFFLSLLCCFSGGRRAVSVVSFDKKFVKGQKKNWQEFSPKISDKNNKRVVASVCLATVSPIVRATRSYVLPPLSGIDMVMLTGDASRQC